MLTMSNHARDASVAPVILGSLETQVMEILWRRGECKVKEVMRSLDRDLAYTTVMTTLDRLFRKNLVERRMSGRAYLYLSRVTCQEWKDKVTRDLVEKLLAGPRTSREVVIACLLEAVGRTLGSVASFKCRQVCRRASVVRS